MDIMNSALEKHKEWNGKIEIVSRTPIRTRDELSHAYTPGVAAPCLEIQKNPELSYELTRRHNLVAVITDGTAVLVFAVYSQDGISGSFSGVFPIF